MDIEGAKILEIEMDQLPSSETHTLISKIFNASLGKCLIKRGTTLFLFDLVGKYLFFND